MARLRLRAVFFDWDGTLVDSAAATYRCYERIFRSFGVSFDRERFQTCYSPDWYRTYEGVGLPTERWPEADRLWLELYAQETCALVSGAREALDRLRRAGLPAGIVTSGSRGRVTPELAALGLTDSFRVLVCSEDARRKKPHPDPLYVGLERLGVEAGEAAYVGDSPEDVKMARAAGVFSVGVPGGFPNREALREAAPDLWAESLVEAAEALVGAAKG